ncbi:MAG TPA: hypothetical protein DCM14_03525 [Clostridiales bacterium UBA8153]|nr:hypothetical protein [Clostridiales bacterium UBA8153]
MTRLSGTGDRLPYQARERHQLFLGLAHDLRASPATPGARPKDRQLPAGRSPDFRGETMLLGVSPTGCPRPAWSGEERVER